MRRVMRAKVDRDRIQRGKKRERERGSPKVSQIGGHLPLSSMQEMLPGKRSRGRDGLAGVPGPAQRLSLHDGVWGGPAGSAAVL